MTWSFLSSSIGISFEDIAEMLVFSMCSLFLLTGVLMFVKSRMAPIVGFLCTFMVIASHDNPFIFYGS